MLLFERVEQISKHIEQIRVEIFTARLDRVSLVFLSK